MKEKRKLRDKMSLKMVIPGDRIETSDDIEMFNLKNLQNKPVRVHLMSYFCWIVALILNHNVNSVH